MNDNDLIRLFLPIINTGLTNAGYTGVTVKQGNQPTQQGVNTNPSVYFYKLYDKRYGFLRRDDEWDLDNDTMIHTEIQLYETTFQIESLVRQIPLTPYQYTASDLINEVAAIIQSDYARQILTSSNVGILRVSDVRNSYFTDDRDQFEAIPSFDFTLTHRQTRVSTDPVIESVEFDIKRV